MPLSDLIEADRANPGFDREAYDRIARSVLAAGGDVIHDKGRYRAAVEGGRLVMSIGMGWEFAEVEPEVDEGGQKWVRHDPSLLPRWADYAARLDPRPPLSTEVPAVA
jgi:hypothetical protein